jgi:hypothetical protein
LTVLGDYVMASLLVRVAGLTGIFVPFFGAGGRGCFLYLFMVAIALSDMIAGEKFLGDPPASNRVRVRCPISCTRIGGSLRDTVAVMRTVLNAQHFDSVGVSPKAEDRVGIDARAQLPLVVR